VTNDHEQLDEAIDLLSHSQSKKRVSGAKRLRKLGDPAAGSALLAALRDELRDPRTWEPKYQMILALGFVGHTEAVQLLWEIAAMETGHTIIYSGLGDAIVRLSHQSPQDLTSVFEVMQSGNLSMIGGAFCAMAMLRLVANADEIPEIIRMAQNPDAEQQLQGTPKYKPGLRKWVAVAAAGWLHNELVLEFLNECEKYPVMGVDLAARDALDGKYGNWQPY
jgi:HEAT repeat protein